MFLSNDGQANMAQLRLPDSKNLMIQGSDLMILKVLEGYKARTKLFLDNDIDMVTKWQR